MKKILRLATTAVILLLPEGMGAQTDSVYRVHVSGVIEMGLAPYIERSLVEATASNAAAVVLEIETPGGRIDAAQRIVKAIIESDIPVYAFVNSHAWSAGAMIALAADSIFMGPGSSIGAATPVTGDGQKTSEKIVSAMRGEFRALAERRGLDPRIAEAMVDEQIEVPGVVSAGNLLTLTGAEAVRLGIASREVASFAGLLQHVELAHADVRVTAPNWAELLVRFLSHPIVAPLLLSLGTLGLFMEIRTPSFGIAGAVGLGAFAAFFGSHLLIGLAGWEELILLAVGLIALGVEVLVLPGFGVAGVIALLCIGAAIFLSLLGNIPTWDDFARASAVLAGSIMAIIVGMVALFRLLPGVAGRSGLFHHMAMESKTGYISAPKREDLVGARGVTDTDLHPSGIATVGRERLDVVSQGGFVAKGTPVRVVKSDGYRHVVEVVNETLVQ